MRLLDRTLRTIFMSTTLFSFLFIDELPKHIYTNVSPGIKTTSNEQSVFFDDLHSTTLNITYWKTRTSGIASVIPQIDGLHFFISGSNTELKDYNAIACFLPLLRGDYDVNVDFRLINWPTKSGVRSGLGDGTIGLVQRDSFALNESGGGEYYIIHLPGQSPTAKTPTTDMQGSLRFARIGEVISVYYLKGEDWFLLGSKSLNQLDHRMCVNLWTGYNVWAHKDVEMVFENFTVEKGILIFPFFDLPFDYEKHHSLALENWSIPGGRINSWFDHDLPKYTNGDGLLISSGWRELLPQGGQITGHDCFGFSVDTRYCYDGHNGYDFTYEDPDPSTSKTEPITITAAANGIVEFAGWGSYGNQVIIDHKNGFFSLYGHLRDQPLVSSGDNVELGEAIGIMGSTTPNEGSTGTHLHFGVYQDNNGERIWNGESIDKPLDPNGFNGAIDPWTSETNGGPKSYWMWKFDRASQNVVGSAGLSFTDLSEDISVSVPSGFFSAEETIELIHEQEIASPFQNLWYVGSSFWLHLLESSTSGPQQPLLPQTNPISITIAYTDTDILHLDESNLGFFRFDEEIENWEPMTSTLDITHNKITAETLELGHFNLQAPKLCPDDEYITDDNYFGAIPLQSDGTQINRVFDIIEDEDWFQLTSKAGWEYTIQTENLANDVDTILELFSLDGQTIIASDDNSGEEFASQLVWRAPTSGTFFIRIVPKTGSQTGCSASYDLSVKEQAILLLPIITR